MCLAVPMKLVEQKGEYGIVELDGSRWKVGLHLLQKASVGDYVIVHAGFAIQKIDEQNAHETLKMLREIAEFNGKEQGG